MHFHCYDCGKRVLATAEACPHCLASIVHGKRPVERSNVETIAAHSMATKPLSGWQRGFVAVMLLTIWFVFGGVFMLLAHMMPGPSTAWHQASLFLWLSLPVFIVTATSSASRAATVIAILYALAWLLVTSLASGQAGR